MNVTARVAETLLRRCRINMEGINSVARFIARARARDIKGAGLFNGGARRKPHRQVNREIKLRIGEISRGRMF